MLNNFSKNVVFLLFAGFFSVNFSSAQKFRPVDPGNLSFASEFERRAFAPLKTGMPPNELHLLMGIGSASGTEAKAASDMLKQIYAELEKPVEKKKTLDKKVEVITGHLHDKYLKQYRLIANLRELAEEGLYNCVSGTALYALVFDHFGIPFQVYEKPNHVYLTAGTDPPIMVESTRPAEGLFMPGKRYQQSIVNYLTQAKIISEDEVKEKGMEAIFREQYFADKPISLQELAGLQYMNDALLYLELADYAAAKTQFEKAGVLYPQDKILAMVFFTALLKAGASDTETLEGIENLIAAYSLFPEERNSTALATQIKLTFVNYWKNHHTPADLRAVEAILEPVKNDTAVYNFAIADYHMYNIDDAYSERNYKAVHEHAAAAMRLDPENKSIRAAFAEGYVINLTLADNPMMLLDSLDAFGARHPFFKTMPIARSAYGSAYLSMAAVMFIGEDFAEAEGYIEKFQEYSADSMPQNITPYLTGAYAEGVKAYFRKSNFKRAKYFLEEMIRLAPYDKLTAYTKRVFGPDLDID